MQRLTLAARKVSASGDYSLRLTPDNDDELGQLMTDFNAMLDMIQQRDARLQRNQGELEDQVRQRIWIVGFGNAPRNCATPRSRW